MTASALIDPARERAYAKDLARGFGGALIFGFPLLMTMEMWRFGLYLDRPRLAVFIGLSLPLLYGLAKYAGFSRHRGLRHDLLDAFGALAVGFVTSGVLLALFGVLTPDATADEIAGKLALQAMPAAVGALLARRQLAGAGGKDDGDEDDASYFGEVFLMAAGALFLAFNVAPTEEMILIAYKMSPWHTLALAVLSIALLHAFVYSVGFAGQEAHDRPWVAFAHYTLVGYGVALVVSLYVLWTFGRTDGQAVAELVSTTVVLAFPAALGAAAARLLV